MDEVIEQLQSASETVPVPLELPDEDDLLDIEESLHFTLPASLREFLLTVSDVVLPPLEPVTAADPTSHTFFPDVLIEARQAGVPLEYLPFCRYPNGRDYYCLTAAEEVVSWPDPENRTDYESIWEWALRVWLANSEPS